jgi:hypothetical protein
MNTNEDCQSNRSPPPKKLPKISVDSFNLSTLESHLPSVSRRWPNISILSVPCQCRQFSLRVFKKHTNVSSSGEILRENLISPQHLHGRSIAASMAGGGVQSG